MGQWPLAESLLLGQIAQFPESVDLLSALTLTYVQQRRVKRATAVFHKLLSLASYRDQSSLRALTLILDPSHGRSVDPKLEIPDAADPWDLLAWISSCQIALHEKKPVLMQQLLHKLDLFDIPEVCVARSWYLRACGQLDEAYKQIHPVSQRAPHLLQPIVLGLEIIMQGQMSNLVFPALRHAVHFHGEHPALLGIATSVNLLKRQHGLARRTSLLERCWSSVQYRDTHVDNQLSTYENNGQSHWLEYIHPSLNCTDADFNDVHRLNLHANRSLQLASIGSDLTQKHLQTYLPLFRSSAAYLSSKQICGPLKHNISNPRNLHIVWLTSDFGSHPVGRFLLSFLESNLFLITVTLLSQH